MHGKAVSDQIKSFIVRHFPLARHCDINNDDQLLENGILDSLGVLELVIYMEQEFKISVSEEELVPENFQTIECVAAFIENKRNANSEQLV